MLGDPQNVQLGNVTTAVLPGRCRASRVLICVSCGGAFSSFFLLCILGHLPSVHPWLPGGIARATDITLRTACLPHRVCVAWCRGVPWWFVARLCGGVLSDVLVTGKGMESSSCGDGRWMFRFTAAGTCCMLRPCVRRRMLAIISGCFGLPRPVFCGMLVEVSLAVDEIFCVRAFVSERERERERDDGGGWTGTEFIWLSYCILFISDFLLHSCSSIGQTHREYRVIITIVVNSPQMFL